MMKKPHGNIGNRHAAKEQPKSDLVCCRTLPEIARLLEKESARTGMTVSGIVNAILLNWARKQ